MNLSAEINMTFEFSFNLRPIALIKWVLPKPTPPYINKGLYLESCDVIFLADKKARLLLLPIIKFSKFKFGLSLL